WVLVDLDSTNGTFVDGERVHGESPLAPGAAVRFGDVQLVFEPTDDAVAVAKGGGTQVLRTPHSVPPAAKPTPSKPVPSKPPTAGSSSSRTAWAGTRRAKWRARWRCATSRASSDQSADSATTRWPTGCARRSGPPTAPSSSAPSPSTTSAAWAPL